ncbi:hypothetical protein [Endozoicomonas sp.]|uniref:hypothetical protein n=1 Tax=Endozoicomonas sp. TaxID=1892382 RepID=UPI003AF9C83C
MAVAGEGTEVGGAVLGGAAVAGVGVGVGVGLGVASASSGNSTGDTLERVPTGNQKIGVPLTPGIFTTTSSDDLEIEHTHSPNSGKSVSPPSSAYQTTASDIIAEKHTTFTQKPVTDPLPTAGIILQKTASSTDPKIFITPTIAQTDSPSTDLTKEKAREIIQRLLDLRGGLQTLTLKIITELGKQFHLALKNSKTSQTGVTAIPPNTSTKSLTKKPGSPSLTRHGIVFPDANREEAIEIIKKLKTIRGDMQKISRYVILQLEDRFDIEPKHHFNKK